MMYDSEDVVEVSRVQSDSDASYKKYPNPKPSTSSRNKKQRIDRIISSESEENLSTSDCDETEKCAICLGHIKGKIGSPDAVGCDHYFCLLCILEWAKNNASCPQDRRHFNKIIVRKNIGGNILEKISVEIKKEQHLSVVEENPTYCEVCGSCEREDCLLLCDGCDSGYHLECLTPPLSEVPIEEWFCPLCAAAGFPQVISATTSLQDVESKSLAPILQNKRVAEEIRNRTVINRSGIRRRIPRTRETERILQRITRARRKEKKRKKKKRKRHSKNCDEEKGLLLPEKAKPFGSIGNDNIDAAFNDDEYADKLLNATLEFTPRNVTAAKLFNSRMSVPSAGYLGQTVHPKVEASNNNTASDILSNILGNQNRLLSKSSDVIISDSDSFSLKGEDKKMDFIHSENVSNIIPFPPPSKTVQVFEGSKHEDRDRKRRNASYQQRRSKSPANTDRSFHRSHSNKYDTPSHISKRRDENYHNSFRRKSRSKSLDRFRDRSVHHRGRTFHESRKLISQSKDRRRYSRYRSSRSRSKDCNIVRSPRRFNSRSKSPRRRTSHSKYQRRRNSRSKTPPRRQNYSPDKSTIRRPSFSESQRRHYYRSKSPQRRSSFSRSPRRRSSHSRSPRRMSSHSRSPRRQSKTARKLNSRSRSPKRLISHSKSPITKLYTCISPTRSNSESKSPRSEIYCSKSPERINSVSKSSITNISHSKSPLRESSSSPRGDTNISKSPSETSHCISPGNEICDVKSQQWNISLSEVPSDFNSEIKPSRSIASSSLLKSPERLYSIDSPTYKSPDKIDSNSLQPSWRSLGRLPSPSPNHKEKKKSKSFWSNSFNAETFVSPSNDNSESSRYSMKLSSTPLESNRFHNLFSKEPTPPIKEHSLHIKENSPQNKENSPQNKENSPQNKEFSPRNEELYSPQNKPLSSPIKKYSLPSRETSPNDKEASSHSIKESSPEPPRKKSLLKNVCLENGASSSSSEVEKKPVSNIKLLTDAFIDEKASDISPLKERSFSHYGPNIKIKAIFGDNDITAESKSTPYDPCNLGFDSPTSPSSEASSYDPSKVSQGSPYDPALAGLDSPLLKRKSAVGDSPYDPVTAGNDSPYDPSSAGVESSPYDPDQALAYSPIDPISPVDSCTSPPRNIFSPVDNMSEVDPDDFKNIANASEFVSSLPDCNDITSLSEQNRRIISSSRKNTIKRSDTDLPPNNQSSKKRKEEKRFSLEDSSLFVDAFESPAKMTLSLDSEETIRTKLKKIDENINKDTTSGNLMIYERLFNSGKFSAPPSVIVKERSSDLKKKESKRDEVSIKIKEIKDAGIKIKEIKNTTDINTMIIKKPELNFDEIGLKRHPIKKNKAVETIADDSKVSLSKIDKTELEAKVVKEANKYLYPYYQDKCFSKQIYKEIMEKIVRKVLERERSLTIKADKIQKLVDGYVQLHLHKLKKKSKTSS